MGDERDRIIKPEEVAGAILGGALHPGLVLSPQAIPRELEARGGGGPPLARSGIIDIDGMDQGRMDPNLCDGRVWGSPMRIRQGSQQCLDADARVDTDPGWGRTDTILSTDGPHTMARATLNASEMLEFSVDVLQPPLGFSVWAFVDYGGGSTSVRKLIRCDYRQDLSIVACFLQIAVYIGDKFGVPLTKLDLKFLPGEEPVAQVAVQVSRGIRGLPYVASNFIVLSKATEGLLIAAPARLLSVTAHLATVQAMPVFLQLYDSGSAVVPAFASTSFEAEYALGTSPATDVNIRFINPRAFARGVFFSTSAVSGDLTVGGVAPIHIEIEQLVL